MSGDTLADRCRLAELACERNGHALHIWHTDHHDSQARNRCTRC